MTDPAITPAVAHLLAIVANNHSTTREKLAACETLLGYEAPQPVTERAKAFLVRVMANPQKYRTEHRLLAGRLLRRAESKRVIQKSVGAEVSPQWRETWRRWRVAKRRERLDALGLWPCPEGWDRNLLDEPESSDPGSP